MAVRRASAIVAFLAVGLGLLHALAYVSVVVAPDLTARDHHDYEQQVRRLLDRAESVTALSVGSSHSRALDFAAMGEAGFHLWRGGGDLFEAVYLARTMAPRLPALETVYVSVSYFSFAVDNATDDERAVRRRQLYFSVPAHEWIPGDVDNFLRGKARRVVPVEAIVRPDHWRGVIDRVLSRPQVASPLPRDRFGQIADARYRRCTSLPRDELREHARSRGERHVRLTDEMTSIRPDVERRAEEALNRLVADMHQRGVHVVLYTPPYSRPYNEQVADRLKRRSRAVAARVARSAGAQFVDFSEDDGFTDDPALFMNSDHLNRCGARLFSRALRDAVHAEAP